MIAQVKAIQFTGAWTDAHRIQSMLGRKLSPPVGEHHVFVDHLRFVKGDYIVLFDDGCIAKLHKEVFEERWTKKHQCVSSPSEESIIYIRKNETT